MAAGAFRRGRGNPFGDGAPHHETAPKSTAQEAAHHLDALEGMVKGAKGRAALAYLRSELTGEGATSPTGRKDKAQETKSAALSRFAA